MSALGEVLETARRARGLTQAQLADRVGITQAALSRYENDLRDPDPDTLAGLAGALGVTPGFLIGAGRARGGMAMNAHMRRRASATPGTWRRLDARLNMYRWHARHLFEEVILRAEQYVPTLDLLDVTPEQAARFVRAQWRMPAGPVRHLAQWLEAAGCRLIGEDFATARVDGLSQWVGEHPVILFNTAAPPGSAWSDPGPGARPSGAARRCALGRRRRGPGQRVRRGVPDARRGDPALAA
ncbi:MAG: ImmA/IrrE family metallo-endopeptidase [Pseudonocardia sp.]|nr:ImmA/IrrE family metallo-endopeptidase [Pseudonocardia sp.]